ncbi:MAG: DNA mismatch repair protein MutL [Candidatus Anoxychlamydiales bacterium]|nr:DNA mismatch repair protein MutL [Candidatus Anoxychlamydiales bacterium]
MSKSIQILDDNVINKIAAGEVIESPVSAIKELVENSIDADAKNIVIEVKKSGLELIRVEDDGIGMTNKDAHLCFKRHATSKIKTFDDLAVVDSMGFRGEALASIASVSKVEIKTSIDSVATHLKLDRSKIIFEKEIARTKGTTIDIKSLFFNVPVRKKFQKTLSYLNSEIVKVINNLSLTRPDIGFKLILNSDIKISTKPQDIDKKTAFKNRIKNLLAKDVMKNAIEVDFSENNIEIFGLISDPNFSKKTKTHQYLIVNNRAIKSALISKFIKEAYFTRIQESEYPVFALHIKIPFHFVDVNVHPQKKEIRIRELIFIKQAIKNAVDTAFENKFQKNKISRDNNFFSADFNFTKPEIKNENFSFEDIQKENIFKNFEKQLIFEKFYDIENLDLEFLKIDHFLFIETKFLRGFLDIEDDEKIVVFDLSSIFLTSLFEKIKNKERQLKLQTLLVPINVSLNVSDILFVEENLKGFLDYGFDLRVISKDQISIDATFQMLEKENIKELFFLILEDLKHLNSTSLMDKTYEKKIATQISKIAKTKSYTEEEAIDLLSSFIKNKNTNVDPLGQSIFKKLNKNGIEKILKG